MGNANDYAASTWLVQKADYEAMFGPRCRRSRSTRASTPSEHSKKQLLEGDHDVFGDGTVVLKHTPGHTPGHQSLYVKLAKTGGVVLSGDLYHYPEERTLDRMPEREKATGTAASRAALEHVHDPGEGAALDRARHQRLLAAEKAPEYYE